MGNGTMESMVQVLRAGLTAHSEDATEKDGNSKPGVMIRGVANGVPVSLKLSVDELAHLVAIVGATDGIPSSTN